MPSPFLRSSGEPRWAFYCSLCETSLQSKLPRPGSPLIEHEKHVAQAKGALLKEWNEHFAETHPQQWGRKSSELSFAICVAYNGNRPKIDQILGGEKYEETAVSRYSPARRRIRVPVARARCNEEGSRHQTRRPGNEGR